MSLIKKTIIFFTLIILSSSHLLAQELKKVGKFKDWQAMVIYEPSGKVCFAQSSPKIQAPKSKKRKAKLFVTFRPEDNISNEVNKIQNLA